MGSVVATPAPPNDIEIKQGIVVTQRLLDQISGHQRSRDASAEGQDVSKGTGHPSAATDLLSQATAGKLWEPVNYEDKLAELHRRGDLLLKKGREEVAAIEERAQQLIHSEYIAPTREAACQDKAAACLTCYQQHAQEVWKCRSAVDAYSACAKSAFADFVK